MDKAPLKPVVPDPEALQQSTNEAVLAFQTKPEEIEQDPMMQAIQKQFGEEMEPTTLQTQAAMSSQLPEQGEVFRCTNLTKAYGKGVAYSEVIKGASFVVKEGEYVVIYGPSGSGKSTLLHMLAGLEIPTRGEIRIRNHVIQKFTDDELAFYHREEIGMVFQNFNLLQSLTIWENVAFPLMLAGAPLEWRRHEALKILDHFQLADFASYYPNQISGGQQQRVSIARALIHDPDLLLIDEPTGNLDSVSSNIVIEEIDRLHKQEERTIILVTHSEVFLPYATRVFYIKDGTLLTSNEYSSLDSSERPSQSGLELPTPQPPAV